MLNCRGEKDKTKLKEMYWERDVLNTFGMWPLNLFTAEVIDPESNVKGMFPVLLKY